MKISYFSDIDCMGIKQPDIYAKAEGATASYWYAFAWIEDWIKDYENCGGYIP